jgi:hypothetical protein
VLKIDPYNKAAIDGIKNVANRYADLAEVALDKFSYVKARRYIELGQDIDPDNSRLLQLRKRTNILTDAPERIIEKLKSLSD